MFSASWTNNRLTQSRAGLDEVVALVSFGATYLTLGEVARAAPLVERARIVALERNVALGLGFSCSAVPVKKGDPRGRSVRPRAL